MSQWDSGSFSAAADRLGYSKSHVSRQVTRLENRLGTQLLQRSTRKLSLTETGRAYYQRCSDILGQLREVEAAVIDRQDQPRGNLRLTVAGAFGERYVAPAAAQFMQQYPQLHIEMDFTNRRVDLITEGYDLAIRSGVLRDSSLIARRIAERRLVVCGSRDYFDRCGRPQSLQDLRHHNCLVGSLPTWRFREPAGEHIDLKIDGNWHSNNGHALLAAARKGLGLVQLPEFYVYGDIADGRLLTALEHYQAKDTAVWALYPNNRHLAPKVRLFIDHLVAAFADIDYL